MAPKQIQEDMQATLRESCPSYTMIKKWAAKFERPGRPATATYQHNVDKICGMIMGDRLLIVREIADVIWYKL